MILTFYLFYKNAAPMGLKALVDKIYRMITIIPAPSGRKFGNKNLIKNRLESCRGEIIIAFWKCQSPFIFSKNLTSFFAFTEKLGGPTTSNI
jgi:hypothetical protein